MELVDLEAGVKAVAAGGNTFNCQEMTCIQASLNQIKLEEDYTAIMLWGRINGKDSDYYIAYGMRDDEFEFPLKEFYYSGEDFEFKRLDVLDEEGSERLRKLGLTAPLDGNPLLDLEADPNADPPLDGEEKAPDPHQVLEWKRLSALVQEIDFDTSVVPVGSYSLNERHVVTPSGKFKGLGLTEAADVTKYVHFRPPTNVASRRALSRADIQFYSDFLDPICDDLPIGAWAVRQDPSIALVTIRSLSWPGYIAYHIPGTPKYGGLYFGYAQKNRDLPFLL